jgi:hypothetical protein
MVFELFCDNFFEKYNHAGKLFIHRVLLRIYKALDKGCKIIGVRDCRKNNDEIDNNPCPICLTNSTELTGTFEHTSSKIFVQICENNHFVCTTCFSDYIKNNVKTCPLCRSNNMFVATTQLPTQPNVSELINNLSIYQPFCKLVKYGHYKTYGIQIYRVVEKMFYSISTIKTITEHTDPTRIQESIQTAQPMDTSYGRPIERNRQANPLVQDQRPIIQNQHADTQPDVFLLGWIAQRLADGDILLDNETLRVYNNYANRNH